MQDNAELLLGVNDSVMRLALNFAPKRNNQTTLLFDYVHFSKRVVCFRAENFVALHHLERRIVAL